MNIYCDIETLPGETRPDPSEIAAPSNYRDPLKIAAYQQEKVEEVYRKQALDSMQGRLLCIGFQLEDQAPQVLTVGLDGIEREADLLRHFENIVIEECGRDRPEWIAFNGHSFDLPWLWRKSIKHGLEYLPRLINFDRYKGNITDTMRLWCPHDYRGFVSLGDLASYLGLGAKTQGFDGSMVFDAWKDGRLEEISEYCKQDVALLAKIHQKLTPYMN